MTGKLIENSERGITLSKSLAWTMLVGLATLVWWGASTITRMEDTIETLTAIMAETRGQIVETRSGAAAATAQLEGRVRSLETGASRLDARYDALAASMAEVKEALRENSTLLRQLVRGDPNP